MIHYEDLRAVNQPFHKEFHDRFREVLDRGQFILGGEVTQFETEFAAYCGCDYGIGVGNGLDALTIMLRSFQFPLQGEVIVPSNTHMATVLAVLNAGLRPVLAEPDIRTYNLDPQSARAAVTKNAVAILAVHLYGHCAPMAELTEIADEYGLTLLEDCAQAHGASINGRKAGCWGKAAAFSFYPTKNLGALGDGGFITTNDLNTFERCRVLRNYGSTQKNVYELPGVNSRLDELQAAFLRVKLSHLEELNDHRRRLASLYQAGLRKDFVLPLKQEGYVDVHHIYSIRHPERDRLQTYLMANHIETLIHYPVPLHRQEALRHLVGGKKFPIAEEISNTILSLPISTAHDTTKVSYIVELMNAFA